MAALMPGMNGSVNVTGSASMGGNSGTEGGALLSAVSAALSGAAVYMDGRKVGELVVGYYDSAARRGLVRV